MKISNANQYMDNALKATSTESNKGFDEIVQQTNSIATSTPKRQIVDDKAQELGQMYMRHTQERKQMSDMYMQKFDQILNQYSLEFRQINNEHKKEYDKLLEQVEYDGLLPMYSNDVAVITTRYEELRQIHKRHGQIWDRLWDQFSHNWQKLIDQDSQNFLEISDKHDKEYTEIWNKYDPSHVTATDSNKLIDATQNTKNITEVKNIKDSNVNWDAMLNNYRMSHMQQHNNVLLDQFLEAEKKP